MTATLEYMPKKKQEPTTHIRARVVTAEKLDIIARQRGTDIPSLLDRLFGDQIDSEYLKSLRELQKLPSIKKETA